MAGSETDSDAGMLAKNGIYNVYISKLYVKKDNSSTKHTVAE